jgi:hypothetical protein
MGLSEQEPWSSLSPYVDPDVLYRVTEDGQGRQTYNPRLVLLDKCGALGSWSTQGQGNALKLDEEAEERARKIATWGGRTHIHKR